MEQLKGNWREAAVDDETRAILEFAEKITRDATSTRESDIQRLKAQGLTERQILDVVLIASHFNLVNRIASALGVEPPAGVE